MRTEGGTAPITIVHASIERSLFSTAIGQVNLNLTLTVHKTVRRQGKRRNPHLGIARLTGAALLAGLLAPGVAFAQTWGIERQKPDGNWGPMIKQTGVGVARQQVKTFCDVELAARLKWSAPSAVRVTQFSSQKAATEASGKTKAIACGALAQRPALLEELLPFPNKSTACVNETAILWD